MKITEAKDPDDTEDQGPPLEPITDEDRALLAQTYRGGILGMRVAKFALPLLCVGTPLWSIYIGGALQSGHMPDKDELILLGFGIFIGLIGWFVSSLVGNNNAAIVAGANAKQVYHGTLSHEKALNIIKTAHRNGGGVVMVIADDGEYFMDIDAALMTEDMQYGDKVFLEMAVAPAGGEPIGYTAPLRVRKA